MLNSIVKLLLNVLICTTIINKNHNNYILVLGGSLSKTVLYQAPDECRWSGYTESDIQLICHLRTINSELENTNFSVIQPQNTIRLRLECNDQLFFQSSLSPGSFKSLIELRSLSIEYCKLKNLTDGSFNGLNDLKNLTIRTHNSDWSSISLDISNNVFNDIIQLERLDLSDNNIWLIPDGMICSLKNLQYLNISNNQIQDISNFHFTSTLSKTTTTSSSSNQRQQQHQQQNHQQQSRICGTSIKYLDLSNNKITKLPSAIFAGLGRLSNLYLKNNEMNYIADRAFEGLVSLQYVDLSENKLNNLPPELFSESKYLKEIYLQNNSINVLAPGLFSDLTELLVLDLSYNELNSQWINSVTFLGLKRLIILNLSSNKINKLESTIFKSLNSLQILKLQDNYIDNIPDGTFKDLSNLHTLILSNNRISQIDTLTFSGIYNIHILSLDYNRIYKIDINSLKNCTTLQDLHLNGNKLQQIPDILQYVPLLKTLDLGENQIKNIDNMNYLNIENLYGLRLTENNIEYIKKGVFDRMLSLQILNLSRNRIKNIEIGTFNKNQNLQAIRLDGNQLITIDNLFINLQNLVWLNISDNNLEKFNYSQIPYGLQWLDIHSNRINQLDNYLNKIDSQHQLSLTTLDASSNLLIDVTANSIPDSIEILYLNDNLISKIESYTFFKKPNLTRVDLFGNKIVTLDPNALRLSPIPDDKLIPEFYIAGNPFQCDCNLDWLQKKNIEGRTQPKLMDLSKINCKLLYNRGKTLIPLIEAKSQEFLCKYETHCFALCHCCDFYACDCKMECPNGCKCYHDQSWTSNVVDCSNANYKNSLPEHIPMDSTQLYLDGNNFNDIVSHTFIGRKRLKILFLNNSNIEFIRNRTFYGLRELEILQLHHNNIKELYGNEFQDLENLKELYLQYNHIKFIDNFTFAHLHHLKILRLDNNMIQELSFWSMPPYLNEIYLAYNKWKCDCQFIAKFRDYINRNNIIQDKNKLKCYMSINSTKIDAVNNQNIISNSDDDDDDGLPFIIFPGNSTTSSTSSTSATATSSTTNSTPNLKNSIICLNHDHEIIDGDLMIKNLTSTKTILSPQQIQMNVPFLITILSGFLMIIIFTLLIFIFRQEMRVWFHSRFGIRLFYNSKNVDKNERDKHFDAFISYSSKDETFIMEQLAPMLENGDTRYKLCLHYRDFPVGAYIADTIVQAVESSRRTIMVLSENFIKSEWCRFEFKSAHHQVLRDRKKRLIVILLGEVPQKDLDPDIRLYLKTNTYLQWGDKLFWEKLRFALPDVPNNQRRMHCNFQVQPIQHTNFRSHNSVRSSDRQNNRNLHSAHQQQQQQQAAMIAAAAAAHHQQHHQQQHQQQQHQQQQQQPQHHHQLQQQQQQQQQQQGNHGRNSSSPRTVAIHI